MNHINIEEAIYLIKSIPADQAIHKMKSILSGIPESCKINGSLHITYIEKTK